PDMGRVCLRAGDWVRLSAQRYADRSALVFGDGSSRTFAELNARVNRLAHSLTGAGVSKGSRIAIMGLDGGPYLEVLLACLKLRAGYVPLNYKLAPTEVHTFVARAEAEVFFADDRYADVARSLRDQVPSLRLVASLDGDRSGIA